MILLAIGRAHTRAPLRRGLKRVHRRGWPRPRRTRKPALAPKPPSCVKSRILLRGMIPSWVCAPFLWSLWSLVRGGGHACGIPALHNNGNGGHPQIAQMTPMAPADSGRTATTRLPRAPWLRSEPRRLAMTAGTATTVTADFADFADWARLRREGWEERTPAEREDGGIRCAPMGPSPSHWCYTHSKRPFDKASAVW